MIDNLLIFIVCLVSEKHFVLDYLLRIGTFAILTNHITGKSHDKISRSLVNSFLTWYIFGLAMQHRSNMEISAIRSLSVNMSMLYTAIQLNTNYNVFRIFCNVLSLYWIFPPNSFKITLVLSNNSTQ